ncbi:MAG: AMP-binding protein [Pseudomonadota bacterium]
MPQTAIDLSKAAQSRGLDVPALLASRVSRHPDKPFLIWEPFEGEPETWTYRGFQEQVFSLAGGLYGKGVQAGDKVLLHMDNCPEFIFAWFACAQLGAVAVSTNTRAVSRDMRYFAEHAEIVCALTQPQYLKLVAESAPALRFIAVTDTDSGAMADPLSGTDAIALSGLMQTATPAPQRPVDPMADLAIQYTSGTTSRPKAVLWTHANATWGARLNAIHFRLSAGDRCLTFLPLYHTNAQSYSMLGTLQVGGSMVVQPRFSASRFWSVALRNHCTWCSMIPFCVKALVKQPIPEEHSFRLWITVVSMPDVAALFAVDTLGLWGMTETITQGIVEDVDDPGPFMSIGRASPGYDIALLDDNNRWIKPGETGRLLIRGTRGVSLFKEYYKNPEANSSAFDEDGWFDTGDRVQLADDGLLYFKDRDKDMLKVGAENVAASEVEAVIMETGWVDECAVVGQKHDMLDEVPVVFLIPLPDAPKNIEAAVVQTCEQQLPDFKVVRGVHVVDALPRSTLEKIAKNELRDRLPEIVSERADFKTSTSKSA